MRRAAPWTNVYGVSRSLIALGTLSTLGLHSADQLFRPLGHQVAEIRGDSVISRIDLFSILGGEHLEVARILAIGILLLVVVGWRPRITGILHWWVSFSFAVSSIVLEGGDQITSNLALLMIPITLTDGRRWHWQRGREGEATTGRQVAAMIAMSAVMAIRVQMAVVYLHAFVGKLRVAEWANGTAVYYWFLHPGFGVAPWLRPTAHAVLSYSFVVTGITWSVLLLELTLFTGLVMNRRYWPYLLWAGLAFHFGIVVVHGLGAFFLAMAGGLVVYLRPPEQEFAVARWPRAATALSHVQTILKARSFAHLGPRFASRFAPGERALDSSSD